MFNRPLFSEILPKNEGWSPKMQDSRVQYLGNLMLPNWALVSVSKPLSRPWMKHLGLTTAKCLMTLRKCGTTFKQSHTLQLLMYWAIQNVKVQTGSKNMMKRSSHCLLRNRRLTLNTWHVSHNKKIGFSPCQS